jgi:hypothetical protein
MIDRIHIEQLEIHARVGVADSERAQPQRLTAGGSRLPLILQNRGLRFVARVSLPTGVTDSSSINPTVFTLSNSRSRRLLELPKRYVRALQAALHYELEQVSRRDILRKLKHRFGARTIHDIRFRLG